MKLTVLLLCMMFKVVFTHDLVNPSKPVILKADTEAKLKLFEVFNEEDPYTDNFDLSIVCYDYKDKPFYFTSSSSDICKSTFNGSIYRLNEQISDLSIYIDKSALSEIEKGRLSVKYVLTDQTGNIKEFRFNIFTKIPITYVNEFSFQPRRNINNISENIATIDENYLKAYSNGKDYNYTSFDVKLDISSNLQQHIDSDTVHWRFINNSLKLQFSIPITVTKQFSIKVAIKDSKTDLSSDTFTVFFSSSDIESSSSAKITILVLFFVFEHQLGDMCADDSSSSSSSSSSRRFDWQNGMLWLQYYCCCCCCCCYYYRGLWWWRWQQLYYYL